ncbi:MAG: plasmid pRiA4b ORF-3 family protein [Micropruina sp.]|uniref:plasmid pRiA4b ORF-3 family protein n=1 Tax=Micropruina sp. TaxID=2737536 RepID=UPI0039E4713A
MADDNLIPFPGTNLPKSALASLFGQSGFDWLAHSTPKLFPRKPKRVRFVVRVDLDHVRPPIWRRLQLASDLRLDQLHEILQVAMGWTDSHLHHFVMGPGTHSRNVDPFLTDFDLDEGDEGIAESDVRLDEVLAKTGSRLYYEYDFGDSWRHTIRLEKTEPWTDGDPVARCTGGRRACPPEDIGGVPGYMDMLDMLAGRTDGMDVDWVEQVLGWLPDGYDPDAFSVDEVNEEFTVPELPPLAGWHPGVGELALRLANRASGRARADLTRLIVRAAKGPEPTDAEIEALSRRYRRLLEIVGSGIALTAAGYLPPKIVATLHSELGMADQWVGKGNREDQTQPVYLLRTSATALGLLRKTRGRLTVTAAGAKLAADPAALLRHIASRVPLGKPHEQDAGLLTLLIVADEGDPYELRGLTADFLSELGWQTDDPYLDRAAYQWSAPTLDVIRGLAGWLDPEQARLAARVLLRGVRSTPQE